MNDKVNINMGTRKPISRNTGRQVDCHTRAEIYANRHVAEKFREKGFKVSKTYK